LRTLRRIDRFLVIVDRALGRAGNNDLQNYNHTLCARQGGTCDPTQPILPRGAGYLDDGRQIFVKFSYLFRL
jgi:hypothetical protein